MKRPQIIKATLQTLIDSWNKDIECWENHAKEAQTNANNSTDIGHKYRENEVASRCQTRAHEIYRCRRDLQKAIETLF